jgi:alginate O-acetyltransferase complex protein AlgI
LGYMFGIRIPINFNSPYKAVSISDFWRRWHISLSSWLRDYLYIALGGNRRGEKRTYLNLMITMLLGGLWHGANWTFVIWGAFHGVLLVGHQLFNKHVGWEVPNPLAKVLTFVCVVFGWVYFRCETVGKAHYLLYRMVVPTEGLVPAYAGVLSILILISGAIAMAAPNTWEITLKRNSWVNLAVGSLFLVCIFRILTNENTPFLYFQF